MSSLGLGGQEDPSLFTLSDEQQLKVLNAQIELARRRLLKLQKERDLLLYRISTGQPLPVAQTGPAPIQQLSDETLRSIFEFGSEAQRWRNPSLMLVCKRWYRLVMEYPRLWNTVCLYAKRVEDFPALSDYASTCLVRSGNLPLHIALEYCADARASHEIDTPPMHDGSNKTLSHAPKDAKSRRDNTLSELALILTINTLRGYKDAHVHRWRSLELCLNSSITISPPLQRAIDVPANNLVWIALRGPPLLPPYHNLLRHFGRVQKLYLSMPLDLSRTSLRDSQIQALSLSQATSRSFLAVASSGFLSLSALRLDMETDPKGMCDIIQLPALRHLTVNGCWVNANMKRFNTPKLTHLYVNCDFFSEEEDPLASLLLLAGGVTDLHWKRRWGYHAIRHLDALLHFAPSLQTIWATCPTRESEIIEKLIEKGATKARLVFELDE